MTTALRRVLLAALTGLAALPLFLAVPAPQRSASESAGGTAAVPDRDLPGPAAAVGVPERFVIEVTGRDFRWHFRYVQPAVAPSAAGDEDSIHELLLPVGASVELRLTSDDYIYVFSVPELGIKQVAVPGLTHQAQCVTAQAVAYDLLADPLCSFRFYHDELMGRIVVRPEVRFRPRREST